MLATLILAAAAVSAASEPPKWCSAVSAAHQTALVELYTSQGCSSCPPADRWLSQLEQRYPRTQVVPIALHVSYWDYIGWKDPYARAEFNQRQRDLAAVNGSRSIYTPGVFLQARELPDWSKVERFDAAVRTVVPLVAAVDPASDRCFAALRAGTYRRNPSTTISTPDARSGACRSDAPPMPKIFTSAAAMAMKDMPVRSSARPVRPRARVVRVHA